jgi:hypothetical protein
MAEQQALTMFFVVGQFAINWFHDLYEALW